MRILVRRLGENLGKSLASYLRSFLHDLAKPPFKVSVKICQVKQAPTSREVYFVGGIVCLVSCEV